MTPRRRWRIRLTTTAETDLQNILSWTSEYFGARQAHIYADTLTEAIEALTEGPDLAGFKERNDIGEGLRVLHVARGGRKGRHFLLCRVQAQAKLPAIDVLCLLHNSMDLPRHSVLLEGNDH